MGQKGFHVISALRGRRVWLFSEECKAEDPISFNIGSEWKTFSVSVCFAMYLVEKSTPFCKRSNRSRDVYGIEQMVYECRRMERI